MAVIQNSLVDLVLPYNGPNWPGLAHFTALCYYAGIMLTKTQKTKVIKNTALHEGDTGSPEVQVSLLTKRIEELTDHLKQHAKDRHSRRGLLQMVANRQTHLNYLQKKDTRRYNALIKKLNLKKKA